MFWNHNTTGNNPITVNTGQNLNQRNIWGMPRKDFVDIALKVIGLSTIILAWIGYVNSREEKQKAESEKIKKEYKDSLTSLASKKASILQYYRDSLQLAKENKRSDSDLILKQLAFFSAQETERRNYEQRSRQFQDQWVRQLKELELQKIEERKNVYAHKQLEIYLQTSTTISGLVHNLLSYDNKHNEALKRTLDENSLKIQLLRDERTYELLKLFKEKVDRFEKIIEYSGKTEELLRCVGFIDSTVESSVYIALSDDEYKVDSSQVNTIYKKIGDIEDLINDLINLGTYLFGGKVSDFLIGAQNAKYKLPSLTKERIAQNTSNIIKTSRDIAPRTWQIKFIKECEDGVNSFNHLNSKKHLSEMKKEISLDIEKLALKIQDNMMRANTFLQGAYY
jgi:hypothetical protein